MFCLQGILLDGREIVVKRFSRNSGQSVEQLKNEVVVTGRLHHKNLVRLLGYCVEGDEKFLVYEYVSNRSLDYYLNGLSLHKSFVSSTCIEIRVFAFNKGFWVHYDEFQVTKSSNILNTNMSTFFFTNL